MKNLPIGVFDSGIGGLTVVKSIHEIMPMESIVYFGDTKNMPYGDKDKSTILGYAKNNISFLNSCKVKVIVAACGTISSYIDLIDTSVFGVIKSTCTTAINQTVNKRIGIIGTSASIKSNSYGKCISSINSSISYYQQACPLLAPMIEKNSIRFDIEKLKSVLKSYILPLIEKNIDTLILGCTHYPLVSDIIKNLFGTDLNIINPGKETAISVKKFLKEKQWISDTPSSDKYYVSSDKESFINSAEMFLGTNISSQVYEITNISKEVVSH